MTASGWHARTEPLNQARGRRVVLEREGAPVPRGRVLALWQKDPVFRAFFMDVLAAMPLDAFRWETPPVTRHNLDRPFEFVLLDAPELARAPDPSDFEQHFGNAASGEVVAFMNLGGDALMVVPTPAEPRSAYAHLAAFTRGAPTEQQHLLWQRAGVALENRLGEEPVWLSTAGTGVPWLHVRLDTRPKYYLHAPYRSLS